MKKVLTFGVFDYFHYGHIALFEQAKSLGDYLIVAIQKDEVIKKYKPSATVFYTTEQRIHLIKSLRTVDEVCTYCDVDNDIKTIDFDILAIGEDQNHIGFQNAVKWCKANGKTVVRMHRMKGISSTQIKECVENLK